MLNKIWFWLLFIGILYGFGKSAYLSLQSEVAIGVVDQQPSHSSDSGASDPEASSSGPLGSQVAEDSEVSSSDATTAVSGDSSAEQLSLEKKNPFHETGKAITESALQAATLSVELCIGLIGVMALWLGILNIAREAGLVDAVARLLQPLMRWLFPDVPNGHPAQGAMLMNISANMLGLDNAATPFGLKAMRELQTLNPSEDTATNAMATFLAINTSNVTLVPISIIGLRVAAGSTNAVEPLAGMLLTTSVTTIVAIVAVRTLSHWPRYALPVVSNAISRKEDGSADAESDQPAPSDPKDSVPKQNSTTGG